ncbi:MAG: hypothetical protein ACE5DU_02015 [Nitrosopumilus sp.]
MKNNDESESIQKIIDEISFRKSESKDYKMMNLEKIRIELQDILKFEQDSFKKIEEFSKTQQNSDLEKYLKIICKNTTEREITQIQEIYLKKIDNRFLNSK